MKKSLLAFGLLGSALADNVLDTADEQLPFSNANSLETNIGTSTIVKHSTNAGEFDVTSTISSTSDYYSAIGSQTPKLGLDIGDDTGNIGEGVVLKWSDDPCGTADQTFVDISAKVPIGDPQQCKVNNVAVDNLNLCDIDYTGGNGADWVASGCIKFDRDIKYYGHSQRTIQFYDTYLNNVAATNPYTGANGAVSMKESWKFNLSQMAFTAKSSLGVDTAATIDGANGKATVSVDVKIRVGADDEVFGDCADALEGSPKDLGVQHRGGMIAAFDDYFHSGWKNGQTLGLSSTINSHVSSGSHDGSGTGVNKCKITYSGSVERQFPINDMHAAYYEPASCSSANCEQALRFTYDSTQDGSWDADAIHYRSGTTAISKASVPEAVADAQAEVNGVGWLQKIPLVKSGTNGLFENVADLTSDPTDASDLLQSITFTAVPGTSGCTTHSSELYKLTVSQINDFHSSRERQCLVAYPDPATKYDVPSTFTFAGVPSQPYEPNILQGSASDSAWDYGAFVVTGSDSELITISYTPSNVKTANLTQLSCTTSAVLVVGTGASLKGTAPAATCAFSGDSLTSLDLSDPALFIDNTAIEADQSAASDYADLRCGAVTLSATTDFTTKEKSDFLPTETVAQASAQVVIPADATPPDAIYTLTSDSDVLDHAGTAPGTHSEDVTYNEETVSQSLSRVGDGALVYNCGGNSKQDIVYTKTLTLPCTTQALSHTRSSKVQFTGAQADLSGVANQATTVAETDHFKDEATAMTPFFVTSDAIQHLGADGPNVTCTAPDDFTCAVGDFVAGQGFEISASYTGEHDNIAPGGANIDVSGTFNLAYAYNGQCTPATESDSFKFDVTITPDPNKFRGKITVQDLSNDSTGADVPDQTEEETPASAHIGPMTIRTRLKLNDDETEPKPQYRIIFSADSDTTQQTDYRVKWDDTKVEETTIATDNNPSVATGRSGTTGKPITLSPGGAGNVVLTLKADADSTVDLNAEAAAFTVTITDGDGNTREIQISIINLEPEAKLELTDCANNSQHEMAYGTGPTTVCSDKCCYGTGYQGFKSVSFDLLTLPKTGTGDVADLEAEILDPTGQGDIVVPASKIQILADDSNAGTKTSVTLQTTPACKGMGQFSIKLHNNVGDDTTHVVKFPCRRHAESTNIQKSVVLDYGLVYSASPATLTFDADPTGSSSVIYAGAALTCANGAKGGAASCDSDAGTLLKGSNNVADIRELAQKFDSCGSWDSAAHTGSMDIVRQYTDGSINYCQENVLTISVLNTGQASATVTAGAFGNAQVAYSVSKLEYSADECQTGEFKYLYELAGTITSSASVAGDSHTLSIADSTIDNPTISLAGDSTVELVKAESLCRAVCTDPSLLISDAVTHTFTVVVDVYGEQIHADVQAVLTLGGSPCAAAVQNQLTDDVSIGFSMQESNACPNRVSSAGSYSTAAGQSVNLDQYICATISGASSYTLSLTAFSFSASAGPGKTGTTIADFFYGGFGTLEAGETITVTADWAYDVTTGNRRMLRTTYLLGSSSGESQASIQVISAEVQVQEQIEAAGASQQAPPASDVMAPAPSGVEDHSHDNTALTVGVAVVGVGVLAIVVVMSVQAYQQRRADGGPGGKKGYQRVGRFQSNLAF